MPFSRAFPVVLSALLLFACATSSKTVTETDPTLAEGGVPEACLLKRTATPPPNQGGTTSAPVGAPQAEVIRCVDDFECGAGARCDTALSPPRCVTLYCLPEKAACSAAEQCESGMQCHKGLCNPCNQCGDLCEVDFDKDPKNCGGCGRKISSAQQCVAGEAACPGDRPTLCGDECVDTSTNVRHCGACNKAAPTGGTCNKGKVTCGSSTDLEVCDGACVDLQKDNTSCGACGHVCKGDLTCNAGYCYKPLQTATQDTCNNVCQAGGLRCAAAAVVFTSTTQPTKFVDITCGVLPPAAPAGFVFNSVSCACIER